MSYRKRIPISKLAYYAEDPKLFIKHRGGVVNKVAVRYGNKGHHRAGRQKLGLSGVLVLIIIGVALWLLMR